MSDADTVPELPLIKKYTVPRTIYMHRKTIESQVKHIQQLEAVAFAQQDHAYQQNQTILKLQDKEREQDQKILYLRKLCLLQQKHIEKQANSLVQMRLSLNQHSTSITSIKSDIRKLADNLMETQKSAQQTSSELPDPTPSERVENCVAELELSVEEILSCSMAGLGHERRD